MKYLIENYVIIYTTKGSYKIIYGCNDNSSFVWPLFGLTTQILPIPIEYLKWKIIKEFYS